MKSEIQRTIKKEYCKQTEHHFMCDSALNQPRP